MPEKQQAPDAFSWPEMTRWRPSREFQTAFISAFLIGLIAHLYAFTNFLINSDSMCAVITENDILQSGRWALKFFSLFSWIYEMPVVIGVISLLALACASGLTVRVLELSHPAAIITISALLVTYPTVACVFSFMFTADAYLISLALNILSVYLAKKYRFGWIAAIICLAVATGIYQSYLGCAIGLFLFDCILDLFSETPVLQTVKKGLKYLVVIAAALALYQILWKLRLLRAGLEPYQYRGLDKSVSIGEYISYIGRTWKFFWANASGKSNLIYKIPFIQRGGLQFFIAALLLLIVFKKVYKSIPRLVLIALGVLLLPIALNILTLIVAGRSSTDAMMIYPFMFVFVFSVKLAEMLAGHLLRGSHPALWKAPILLIVLVSGIYCWTNFCSSNAFYLELHLRYESSYALANRIADRMEQLEEYSPDVPVLIVGNALSPQYDIQLDFSPIKHMRIAQALVNKFTITFIRTFLGVTVPEASGKDRARLEESGFLDAMPAFPAKDSVQYHDGIIIIKIGDS